MKRNLTCLIVIIGMITFINCGKKTSSIYLNYAKHTEDKTYGYSESNPILLKCSKKFNYELIIEEYISRLSTERVIGFDIINKSLINENDKTETKYLVKRNDLYKTIFAYNIISQDKSTNCKLYFKLTHSNERLYVPNGLFLAIICR